MSELSPGCCELVQYLTAIYSCFQILLFHECRLISNLIRAQKEFCENNRELEIGLIPLFLIIRASIPEGMALKNYNTHQSKSTRYRILHHRKIWF